MSLAKLIFNTIPCPFNNTIQDSDAVLGPTSRPKSAAEFDLTWGINLLTKSIRQNCIPKDCEVISAHHYPDVPLLMPKYARGGFVTTEPNLPKECNVCIFPILDNITSTIEELRYFTTHSWLTILKG